MKTKIFCHCSLFPSRSGYGPIKTPVNVWSPLSQPMMQRAKSGMLRSKCLHAYSYQL